MQIKDLGEFKFIERIRKKYNKNLPKKVLCGIGDDCAVIEGEKEHQIVTTDMLVENMHFIKKKISPEELGYKSLAVNLSDIAAMGGMPQYAFLSMGLPQNTSIDWLDRFYCGFNDLAKNMDVHLLGGDSVGSSKLIINVCIIGKTKKSKMRSQASLKDIVCTTGMLGDSGGGCKIILEDKKSLDKEMQYLINCHNKPKVFIEEGKWLATKRGVNAMIDLSDGLYSDLQRLQESSNVGFDIDLNNLPISESLKKVSSKFNWDATEIALTGGEDYCLLITIDPQQYESIKKEYENKFNLTLYKIGHVADKEKNSYNLCSKEWKPFNHWGRN